MHMLLLPPPFKRTIKFVFTSYVPNLPPDSFLHIWIIIWNYQKSKY